MLTISFDLHGTLDASPPLREKCAQLRAVQDNLVFIISGPPRQQIKNELADLGMYEDVHYDNIISVADWVRNRYPDLVWQDERGRWYAPDEIWWAAKAVICETWLVDLHIDNEERYGKYFKSGKFLLFK